jgi:hypothetical protein
MQAPVEPTFAQHSWHIAVFFEKLTGSLLVPVKEPGGHQSRCHDFGGGELGLDIVFVVVKGEKIGTKAENCDNLFLHGCPPVSVGWHFHYTKRTVMRTPQGGNLG